MNDRRKTGGSKLASFYESQNEHINGLLKPMSAHSAEAAQDAENNALKVKIAVNASLVANFCFSHIAALCRH